MKPTVIFEPWAAILQYQTKFGTYMRSEHNLERLWEVKTIHLLSNAMPQTYTMISFLHIVIYQVDKNRYIT